MILMIEFKFVFEITLMRKITSDLHTKLNLVSDFLCQNKNKSHQCGSFVISNTNINLDLISEIFSGIMLYH